MDKQERNDLVDIACAAYFNRPSNNYSKEDNCKVFRQALIEINGSDKFTRKDFERGRTNGLFELIEETIQKISEEGIPDDNPLMQFVEEQNYAEGDTGKFYIEDDNLYVVSKIVHGTKQIRRQRLLGGEEITVETDLYGVKIYEELRRLIANRTDIVKFINKVAESFKKKKNEVMYESVVAAFNKLEAPYVANGTYQDAKLLELIDHVEASTGKSAIVLGSKQAVRNITVPGSDSNSAKEDKYNMGYYGHIATTPIIAMKNFHKVGTTTFGLENDLYVVAADDQFIKAVTEGETTIYDGYPEQPEGNHALQKEYMMTQAWGFEVIFAANCAVYHLS